MLAHSLNSSGAVVVHLKQNINSCKEKQKDSVCGSNAFVPFRRLLVDSVNHLLWITEVRRRRLEQMCRRRHNQPCGI